MEKDMTTFGEQLAAAREARPSRDVPIILDGEIAEKKAALMAELETADDEPRLGAKTHAETVREKLEELQEAAVESIVTLRITRIPGGDWSALTTKHPVRLDSPVDMQYGYNIDSLCAAVLRHRDKSGRVYAHRLENGDPVEMTDEDWTELYDVLSGAEVIDIRDAVWALNEYEPQQRLSALVKASGAATRSVSK